MGISDDATSRDDAALRLWLRSQSSPTMRHPKPQWVHAGLNADAVRALVGHLLSKCVSERQLGTAQAAVWESASALRGASLSQSELAQQFSVTKRTVRNWIRRADEVIADALIEVAEEAAGNIDDPAGTDDVMQTAVGVGALVKSLVVDNAPIEYLEAVQAFASDRLGGPRPRRPGARRWVRNRYYKTVNARVSALATRLNDDSVESAPGQSRILAMPYRLHDEPIGAIDELARAWTNRDRIFLPLLANQALSALREHPGLPADYSLHGLEVIANALRDAENLQAFVIGARWKALAERSFGVHDHRAWKAHGLLIHMMQIHGYVEPARSAQQRHVEAFDQIHFPDAADKSIHDLDRFARSITIEVNSPTTGSRERVLDNLRRLREVHERLPADSPDNDFALLRRRIEVQLADAVANTRGQALTRHPEMDPLIDVLESGTDSLEPHRVLAAYELLIEVYASRHDWKSLEQRIGAIESAIADQRAPANLAERIDRRLTELACHGHIDKPEIPMPIDPFRDRRMIPIRDVKSVQ